MAVNFAKDADCKIATPPLGWGPYLVKGTNASELELAPVSTGHLGLTERA